MAENRIERRLAAILAADVVGYSRLVRADEEGTLAVVRSLIEDVIRPAVTEHCGRIFKRMGDAVLAEFGSTVDAARCAIAVQHEITRRGAATTPDRRIAFRIGIHVGDVVVDGDDIQGDGVNVASRIEGLATANGICISEDVFRQIEGRIDVGIEDLGLQQLKNIGSPVPVYKVLPNIAGKGRVVISLSTRLRRLRWPVAALCALAVTLIFTAQFGVFSTRQVELDRPPVEDRALPLPDKPSIAVLPFDDLSDTSKQQWFVDGLTEDLITDLSKVSGLFVVSRSSTFSFKDKEVDLRKVARQLGVKYVLEGSVRRDGEQIRINAQLIDAQTGDHVWADRFDEAIGKIFELQDDITRRVVSELSVTLTAEDQNRLKGTRTDNVEAYEAFLRGWEHFRRYTPSDFAEARNYFQKATELDPDYSRANAALALVYYRAYKLRWAKALGMGWSSAQLRSGRYMAQARQNPTPLAHRVASEMLLDAKRTDDALEQAKHALALNPNDPESNAAVARSLIYIGRPEAAIGFLRSAMRLEASSPAEYTYLLGLAYFGMERFGEAATTFEDALARNPKNFRIKALLAATYSYLKRHTEASAAFQQYFEQEDSGTHYGRWTEPTFWERWPYKSLEDWDRLAKGLLEAAGREFDPHGGGGSAFFR
ncbi:MAG: tetratricopeptide repeat protein [Rhizobiaceae bacterium]